MNEWNHSFRIFAKTLREELHFDLETWIKPFLQVFLLKRIILFLKNPVSKLSTTITYCKKTLQYSMIIRIFFMIIQAQLSWNILIINAISTLYDFYFIFNVDHTKFDTNKYNLKPALAIISKLLLLNLIKVFFNNPWEMYLNLRLDNEDHTINKRQLILDRILFLSYLYLQSKSERTKKQYEHEVLHCIYV